jgi:uncharacterized NAD(P)/FAD-binding protein YdhS
LGEADDFVVRRIYGEYLADLLAKAQRAAGDRLELVQGEAINLETFENRPRIVLADGRHIQADAVVLALGNLPPQLPRGFDLEALRENYSADPWSSGLGDGLSAEDIILLLGTGLTMIDAALQLVASGFEGKMIGLSRRGLLPRPHADAAPHAPAGESLAGLPLSVMVKRVRSRSSSIGWRSAVDELRVSTHDIWRAATADERARFLRHLRPWWDVHRHRVAPELAERLDQLQLEGRLEVLAGKIDAVRVEADHALLSVRPRGYAACRTIAAKKIVNCTGPSGDLNRSELPLLMDLARKGMIRPDFQRLGIDTGEGGKVVASDGTISDWLYALGPIAKGALWEVTAVPDLRHEAAALAHNLAFGVPGGSQ